MKTDKENKKRSWLFLFPILGIVAGLLFLLYPYVMDKYNDYKNSLIITSMSSVYDRYEDNVEELEKQLYQAQLYNQKLAGEKLGPDQLTKVYDEQLSFDGNGIMGYLTIPEIDLQMIIYHGTSDDTLAIGVGHLEKSSLPVGGVSTHCVLTAHSGMKNMKAFDNLRKLEIGDRFYVTVLGNEYWYKVDSIDIVPPEETDSLKIVQGEDRMTLVTCTPYGINDHRLLVHGSRIEKQIDENNDGSLQAGNIDQAIGEFSFKEFLIFDVWITPMLIIGAVGIISIVVLIFGGRRRKNK